MVLKQFCNETPPQIHTFKCLAFPEVWNSFQTILTLHCIQSENKTLRRSVKHFVYS